VAVVDSFPALRAIVWAQWRTSHNAFLRAHKGGVALKWLISLLWYGSWVVGAAGAAFLVSGRLPAAIVERGLPGALFLVFFFWQLFPIVLASQGAFLDMRRLLVYPIPPAHLFLLETALRLSTAVEMILLAAGLFVGLAINPTLPFWAPLPVLPFVAFNLLTATGVKAVLGWLLKKRGVRELAVVGFLALTIAPQFLASGSVKPDQWQWLQRFDTAARLMPWAAAANLALGRSLALSFAALSFWLALSYVFARWQFNRSLRIDEASGEPSAKPQSAHANWLDRLIRIPSALLLDPTAALVEKDLRTLTRAPRFRLIFLMAATMGTLIWLPMALRGKDNWAVSNYLTLTAMYAMLLLGEVLYWNIFGFERASVQQWFVTPIRTADVLRAKNAVAVFVTLLSFCLFTAIAAVLPVRSGPAQILDAFSATIVVLTALLGAGNLASVYLPRPINADDAWRNNSGKAQFFLVFTYPLLNIPIALAYLARWATDNYWSYHAVLAASFLAMLCFYAAATQTAAEVADARKEAIVSALSHQEGPVSITG